MSVPSRSEWWTGWWLWGSRTNPTSQLFAPPVGVFHMRLFGSLVQQFLTWKVILPLSHSSKNERRRKVWGTQILLWRHSSVMQNWAATGPLTTSHLLIWANPSLGAQRSLISGRDLVFEVNTRNKTSDNQRLCRQREEDARDTEGASRKGIWRSSGSNPSVLLSTKPWGPGSLLHPAPEPLASRTGGQVQATCEDTTKGQWALCTRFSLARGVRQFVLTLGPKTHF